MKSLRFIEMIVLYSITIAEACYVHQKRDSSLKINAIWNDMDFIRKTKNSCECGKYTEDNKRPWNIFIHVKTSSGLDERTTLCSGTIITSNLIATSHTCFLLPGRVMNIYDMWKPKDALVDILWSPENVTVSTSKNLSEGLTFPAEEIIYNARYALKSSAKVFPPEFDIALIRMKADFLSDQPLYGPICLPSIEDVKGLEMENVEVYYYGIEDEDVKHDNISINFGVIMPTNDKGCQEALNSTFSSVTTLCYRFSTFGLIPITPGGPLYVDISGKATAFLVGLASMVKTRFTSEGFDYTFFTNLIALTKYIEWQADKHKSSWCKVTTKFQVKRIIGSRERDAGQEGPWPWEVLQSPLTRSENLNCICGLKNNPLTGSGRIVGGVEAVPYEFGWMTAIGLYHNGKDGGRFLCGGSIINDRMILTAAHCVVSNDKAKRGDKHPVIKPENVELFVAVHSRVGDDSRRSQVKVDTVIYHPGYVNAIKEGYFDYDIALLILVQPLTFASESSFGIRPVCLPKMGPYGDVVGLTATVAGWGLINPDMQHTANNLQKIDLPIAPLDMCRVATTRITSRSICAGTLNRYKDAAGGDSGGPLMIVKNNQFIEVGIVSWGEDVRLKTGEIKTAALYADVQRLIGFVDFYAKRIHANWCRSSTSLSTSSNNETDR